jgi:hypothetical protein
MMEITPTRHPVRVMPKACFQHDAKRCAADTGSCSGWQYKMQDPGSRRLRALAGMTGDSGEVAR